MDARGKAKDAVEGPYDVGYYDKAKGITYSRDVVITAGSWDEAMRKAKAGARPGEELYRVSPREKNAVWAKDRLDLGTLALDARRVKDDESRKDSPHGFKPTPNDDFICRVCGKTAMHPLHYKPVKVFAGKRDAGYSSAKDRLDLGTLAL